MTPGGLPQGPRQASEVRSEPGTVPQRSSPGERGRVRSPGQCGRTAVLGRRAVGVMAVARSHRLRALLAAGEWGRVAAMIGFILALNAAGWGIFILDVMPHHFDYHGVNGTQGLGVGFGVAITAWFL